MKAYSALIFCFFYAMFNVFGAALIKSALVTFKKEGHALNSAMDFVNFLLNLKVIIGFGVILLSALIMFKALSVQNFSYVAPLATGINFVLTVVVGVFIFGDKITLSQYIGITLILAGIIAMSLKQQAS